MIDVMESAESTSRDIPKPGLDYDYLFESLICDLQWTALQIGVITTALQSVGSSNLSWSISAWRHIMRDDTAAMHLVLRYASEMNISAVAQQIEKLCEQLSACKRITAPLLLSGARSNESVRRMVSSWRPLCVLAREVSAALDKSIRARLDPFYSENARIVVDFLIDTEAGKTVMVDGSGVVQVPTLAQRRRSPRVSLNVECEILVDNSSVIGRICNASRGGLGITCDRDVSLGHPIVVVLKSGRRFSGRVIWTNGNSAGIELDRALSIDDPLLRSETGRTTA